MATLGEEKIKRFMSFAASSASVEEQAGSALKDGKFPDSSKPISVEKRIWRAQVKSQYCEPEPDIDPSENLDFLYENAGRTILHDKRSLPNRDDLIIFSQDTHGEIFAKLIQMEGLSTRTSDGD